MISALHETRPWIPRHRVSIVGYSGGIIASRTFYTKKAARAWVWQVEKEILLRRFGHIT